MTAAATVNAPPCLPGCAEDHANGIDTTCYVDIDNIDELGISVEYELGIPLIALDTSAADPEDLEQSETIAMPRYITADDAQRIIDALTKAIGVVTAWERSR